MNLSQISVVKSLPVLGAIVGLALASQAPGPARTDPVPTPSGSISGRVLTADTGRPVARARVFIASSDLPQGRAMLTDESGVFQFTGLSVGRYTVTVSKAGFINLSYGQRRPLQAGTPLELADGQVIAGIEFRLPRGSAIAGHVSDEHGDPMPGTFVQVLRYRSSQGNRQLVTAGMAQTDDRGQYRVWGLNPGEYFVSANPSSPGGRGGPGGRGVFFLADRTEILQGAAGRGGRGAAVENDQSGYAPTFYPGVPSINEAQPVAVALGGEAQDIDFRVSLVQTARVSGSVLNSDGNVTWSGNVILFPEAQGGRAGAIGFNYAGRIGYDGLFTITNVPPGRYTLRARSTMRDEPPEFGLLPVTVNGSDVSFNMSLSPGGTIGGTISVEATQSATLPDASQFRISAAAVDPGEFGSGGNVRAEKDGTFKLTAIPEGLHWIRGQAPRGWAMKSVIFEGRDVSDSPIETRAGQTSAGLTVIFTDRLSEISGTLSNDRGQAVTEYTVLAFSTDSTLWQAASRHIMTTRPDQNGKFQIRGLPAGEYYLATVDPSEPDEWFNPAFLERYRVGAARLTLAEGGVTTQDFKVVAR